MSHKTRSASNSDSDSLSTQTFNKLLEKHLKPLNEKIDGLCSSVKKIEARLESIEREQTDQAHSLTYLGDEIGDIKKRIAEVENDSKDHKRIQIEVDNIKAFIESSEHAKRAKCVEVQGIPPAKGENLLEAYRRLLQKLQISVNEQHLDTVYRIKTSNRVVFRFVQAHARDSFLSTFRKSTITVKDLGFKESSRLFINEVLSPEQYTLFYKARMFKRENNVKYIWTSNQKIFMRKTSESQAVEIKSEDSLQHLQSTTN